MRRVGRLQALAQDGGAQGPQPVVDGVGHREGDALGDVGEKFGPRSLRYGHELGVARGLVEGCDGAIGADRVVGRVRDIGGGERGGGPAAVTRSFTTKGFARFAKGEGLPESVSCRVVEAMERGLVGADLGGGVIEQRLPRTGQGTSGVDRAVKAGA